MQPIGMWIRPWTWGLAIMASVVLLPGCGEEGTPSGPQEEEIVVPCEFPDARCRDRFSLGDGFLLPVFRTHDLTRLDTTLTRAVIVVHGAARDPDAYFETMVLATKQAGALRETLVVAPHFQIESDAPASGEPIWTEAGWKKGHLSTNSSSSGARVSSYDAVDRILVTLGDSLRFPRLRKIVVTGHSAGGQYTHRFAAGSRVEELLTGIRFRYVVANPSTFLYLGPERARADGEGFAIPDTVACPGYNLWHYGLEDLNTYMRGAGTLDQVRTRLIGRDVVYLAGQADVGSAQLDVSCGAMLQGENRYLRALTLFAYLGSRFSGHEHRLFELPGVAHSSRAVYTSTIGRDVLFGW